MAAEMSKLFLYSSLATQFFKFLLNLSKENSPHSPVIVIAHSQRALISDLALEHLTPKERKKIRIFTFGGASFITPGKAHSGSHNFISLHDPIPRLASPNLSNILLRREECEGSGLQVCKMEDIRLC